MVLCVSVSGSVGVSSQCWVTEFVKEAMVELMRFNGYLRCSHSFVHKNPLEVFTFICE